LRLILNTRSGGVVGRRYLLASCGFARKAIFLASFKRGRENTEVDEVIPEIFLQEYAGASLAGLLK
jgi:hypothetical protein